MSGCATQTPHLSDLAQGADSATTAVGVYAMGAREANPIASGLVSHPLGMAALTALKFGLPVLARRLPPEECRLLIPWVTGLGFGAAANNLAVIAGISSAGPIGIGVGLASLIWSYHYSAKDECVVVDVIDPEPPSPKATPTWEGWAG